MKLYYSTGACSLSPHIVLCASGLDFSCEKVNLRTKQTETGEDFFNINPKGQVPALQLENGVLLTEGPAIVQYIADLVPEKALLAPVGDINRYKVISWLNYIATELHKNYGPLFNPAAKDEAKLAASKTLADKFRYVEKMLGQQDYLVGEQFTIADAYLFTVLSWRAVILDLPELSILNQYIERIGTLPAVQQAMSQESK